MIEICSDVFYVGVKEPTLRKYDLSVNTPYGTTYNSYIVRGEKTALIDTAPTKCDDYIENIEIPITEIDYLICTHSEPDLSGNIEKILDINPDITVVASIAALRNIRQILNRDFKSQVAKENGKIDLGNGIVLTLYNVPNLHWPDTIAVYLERSGVLFSGDFLGAHYCENGVFDNKIYNKDILKTAQKQYFYDTFTPFKSFVSSALRKLSPLNIDTICPSHGPVLKETDLINKYSLWCADAVTEEKTAAIFYVSAHGYTKQLADIAKKMFTEHGFNTEIFDASVCDGEQMIKSLNSADIFIFGTPTINRNAAKEIWNLVTSIDLINSKDKSSFVFGSYGWGGEGVQLIHNCLKSMKVNVFEKPFTCILKPSDEEISKFKDYVEKFITKEADNIK